MLSLFSRPLKAGVKVLINLCAAIAVTCVLVIFEGLARSSKVRARPVAFKSFNIWVVVQFFILGFNFIFLCFGLY